MGVGSVLVGVAFLAVLVAYVGRPFRSVGEGVDPEKAIELWVARVREAQGLNPQAGEPASPGLRGDAVNYCPECGRLVASSDRFCSGCGTRLRGGDA
jgi:hypothetical protein